VANGCATSRASMPVFHDSARPHYLLFSHSSSLTPRSGPSVPASTGQSCSSRVKEGGRRESPKIPGQLLSFRIDPALHSRAALTVAPAPLQKSTGQSSAAQNAPWKEALHQALVAECGPSNRTLTTAVFQRNAQACRRCLFGKGGGGRPVPNFQKTGRRIPILSGYNRRVRCRRSKPARVGLSSSTKGSLISVQAEAPATAD